MLANRMLMAAAGAGSAITLGTFDSAVDATNATVYTHALTLQPGLWVMGIDITDATNVATISSVTVHIPTVAADPTGTAATSILSRRSGGSGEYFLEAFKVVVAAGTGCEVVVTASEAVLACAIAAQVLIGANSTATDTLSNGDEPLSGGIDTPANGAIVAFAISGGSASNTWTNITERVDTVVETTDAFGMASDAFAAAATVTITCDPNTTPAQRAMVAVAFGP